MNLKVTMTIQVDTARGHLRIYQWYVQWVYGESRISRYLVGPVSVLGCG